MSAWIDANNNFWVFGGENANTNAVYNDLWEFTPSTGLWTWVSGSNATGATGVYGPLGVAAPTNVPSARDNTESWTDSSGNLWLFGGNIGSTTFVNDLWEFTPSLNGGAGEWKQHSRPGRHVQHIGHSYHRKHAWSPRVWMERNRLLW
jgi:hypothetical protein